MLPLFLPGLSPIAPPLFVSDRTSNSATEMAEMQLDDDESYTLRCCHPSPDTSEHDELESDSEQQLDGTSGCDDAGRAVTSEEQLRRQQQQVKDTLQEDSDVQDRRTLEHNAQSASDVSGVLAGRRVASERGAYWLTSSRSSESVDAIGELRMLTML